MAGHMNAARLVCLLAGIAPVWGCGVPGAPGTPPAPEIRRITQNEATSDCIGDPRTPLCAVETFIACWTRREPVLCNRVGQPRGSFEGAALPAPAAEYYLVKLFTIQSKDIPAHLKDAYWYRPGMVNVELKKRGCEATIVDGCDALWTEYNYYLKLVGNQWHLASWSAVDAD
jgi:hypothetical protein